MSLDLIPPKLRKRFHFEERGHACAILSADFSNEFQDICECLRAFTLKKSHIAEPGGSKSKVAKEIDGFLGGRGWAERKFDTKVTVDKKDWETPTHKVDNFKNRIGVEVEWNNKDPFYDRDLNNFRLLHQLSVLSVGVIITRMSELQAEFDRLGRGKSYGNSTTHWSKLIPRVNGGSAGGCPLLLVGLGMECYDESQ